MVKGSGLGVSDADDHAPMLNVGGFYVMGVGRAHCDGAYALVITGLARAWGELKPLN